MNEIQTYLDAIAFLAANTSILTRLGWTLVASIVLGVLFLDKFRLWLWVIFFLAFVGLTQWQINVLMLELGYTQAQIIPPHLITIISGLVFITGSGLGYWIKSRKSLKYTKDSPNKVAVKIIEKVNGGAIETSTDAKYQSY